MDRERTLNWDWAKENEEDLIEEYAGEAVVVYQEDGGRDVREHFDIGKTGLDSEVLETIEELVQDHPAAIVYNVPDPNVENPPPSTV